MSTATRVVVGLLLLAHGLVHLLYVTPSDDPRWPFDLSSSWLVPEPLRRSVGLALMVATVASFGLLALAVLTVPGLADSWAMIAIVASACSLALLVAYWNRQLILGVLIDVGVIVVALTQPSWAQP